MNPTAFDQAVDQLETLMRAKLRRQVQDYLAANRWPLGSRDLARALDAPHYPVQRAVCELVARGELAQVGRAADGKPAYRPIEVGACEWCGLVSHQLVAGECPSCKALTLGAARPSLARQVC